MADPTAIGLIATNAGHVLLVRRAGSTEWEIPRTALGAGETEDTAFWRLIKEFALEIQGRDRLTQREAEGQVFALYRTPIAGLPIDTGHELRLVRLSFLPKELAAPDKALLDALLAS